MLSTHLRALLLPIVVFIIPYTHQMNSSEITMEKCAFAVLGAATVGVVFGWYFKGRSESTKTETTKRREIEQTEEAKRREIEHFTKNSQARELERQRLTQEEARSRTLLASIQHELSQVPNECTYEKIAQFAHRQSNTSWPIINLQEAMLTHKNKLLAIDPALLSQEEITQQKQYLQKIEMVLGAVSNLPSDKLQQESQRRTEHKRTQELHNQELENLRRDGQIQKNHLANLEKLETALNNTNTLTRQQSILLNAQGTVIDRIAHETHRAHKDLVNRVETIVRINVQEGIRRALDTTEQKMTRKIEEQGADIKKTIHEEGKKTQKASSDSLKAHIESLWTKIRSSTPAFSVAPQANQTAGTGG